jgi:uncharacterized protein involved in exopolysaccharide biosynthesis
MDLINRDDNLNLEMRGGGYLERPTSSGGLRQIVSVLFKWKWLILGSFLAISLPVALLTSDPLPRYRASAKLMIKTERAYLAESASDLKLVSNFRQSTAEVINSEIQILQSREVVEGAIKALQLQRHVGAVQGGLDLAPVRDSKVINVSLTSYDPDEPVPLLNAILDVYLRKHANLHNPEGVLSFLEQQVEIYRQRSQDAVHQLQGFEKRVGIIDAETESDAMLQSLTGLRTTRDQLELTMRELRERIAFLTKEVAEQPEDLDIQHDAALNPVYEQLSRQLVELEMERNQLLEHRRDKHPRVLANQREIQATQARLSAEKPSRRGHDVKANPIRISLQQQLLESQGQLLAAVAKRQALSKLISQTQADLLKLGGEKYEQRLLEEDLQARQSKYILYQKKLEEARISEAMDREKLLNVGVIEHAALPVQTIPGGQRKMSIMLAALTGLVLGVGGGLGIELFRTSVTNERELERQLELPVLAAIERFPSK